MELVLLHVLDSWCAVLKCFKGDREASELVLFAEKFTSVPVVEVAENSHSSGSWAPLAESDVVVWLQVDTEPLVGSGDLHDAALSSIEYSKPS